MFYQFQTMYISFNKPHFIRAYWSILIHDNIGLLETYFVFLTLIIILLLCKDNHYLIDLINSLVQILKLAPHYLHFPQVSFIQFQIILILFLSQLIF